MAAQDHSVTSAAGHTRRLRIALALTATFLIVEVVGGLLTGSLALLSDAAHMFTDVAALIISLVAIAIGKRPADKRRTFGYYRFEILGAAFNAGALFGVAFYILFEAWKRFFEPPEIQSIPMLIVAGLGLIVNLISMRLLHEGSKESLNVKGAYLEVWSDLLGSIGVIAAALIVRFTGWRQIDPVLAALIGLWVLPRTWTLLSQSVNVLLEGVPEGLDLEKLYDKLASLPMVKDVHELHVWSLTSGRISMTAHLVVHSGDTAGVLRDAQEVARSHGITHASIQIDDRVSASEEKEPHRFTS